MFLQRLLVEWDILMMNERWAALETSQSSTDKYSGVVEKLILTEAERHGDECNGCNTSSVSLRNLKKIHPLPRLS